MRGGLRGKRGKRQEGQGWGLTCAGENLSALLPPKVPRVLDSQQPSVLSDPELRDRPRGARGYGSLHDAGAGQPAPQKRLNTKGGLGAEE